MKVSLFFLKEVKFYGFENRAYKILATSGQEKKRIKIEKTIFKIFTLCAYRIYILQVALLSVI